ncbi:hypothetical protein FBULB1_7009 [Fusarium bulbicola]|nr:hypothetical protein FBULB1_7009 [Fusarium bulbicola]
MPTIASPLVGICVAWSGLLLAIGSFADTLSTGDDSESMMLFPNDKMGEAKTGWFTYWGIVIVENVIEEGKQGNRLIGKSYRISTTVFNSYYVKAIRLTDNKNKRTLFKINPGTPSYLSYLRLLGIRGVQPQTYLAKGDPGTPQSGDVLSYDQNGAIVGSWGRALDAGGDYFLRAKDANKDTQIAIVQEGNYA